MGAIVTYAECPGCKSQSIAKALVCKDYTVTGDLFEIWECSRCTLRFTQHVPDAASIGAWYQSADYVSHSDTKKGIVNRLYHIVRSYTLGSKRKLVEKVTGKTTGTLLDVGAGTGAFAHTMQSGGWEVTGLEPDTTARGNALKNYGLTLNTLEHLAFMPVNTLDVITLWHVLEHVHDLNGYLDTFLRILKPGGKLVIAVPNYTSKDAEIYNRYWAAYDVPRHLYHFPPLPWIYYLHLKGSG